MSERLRQNIMTKLNLEMGNTEEIMDVALRILPDEVCLVPGKTRRNHHRGRLDVIAQRKELEPTIRRLQVAGIRVSLLSIPPSEEVDVAAELGMETVELHTGKLANAFTEKSKKRAGTTASGCPRRIRISYAGQRWPGINYKNIAFIHQIPYLTMNIGHSIVSRAMWVGLETAVREMLAAMANYPE